MTSSRSRRRLFVGLVVTVGGVVGLGMWRRRRQVARAFAAADAPDAASGKVDHAHDSRTDDGAVLRGAADRWERSAAAPRPAPTLPSPRGLVRGGIAGAVLAAMLVPALTATEIAATDLSWDGVDDGSVPDVFDLADELLAARTMGTGAGEQTEPARRHLAAARHLYDFAVSGRPSEGGDVRWAATLAQAAQAYQAARLGFSPGDAAPLVPHHRSPSEALAALAARHGRFLDQEQLKDVASLDGLGPSVRVALTRLVNVFIAYEEAVAQAYEGVEPDVLEALAAELEGSDGQRRQGALGSGFDDAVPMVRRAGVDLSVVFAARDLLLDASAGLHDAVSAGPESEPTAAAPVAVAPVFSIDVATAPTSYSDDYALLVDFGGDDTYNNNAGGAASAGTDCAPLTALVRAAALVDLAGADRYTSGRSCGVNGGGWWVGAGYLFDAEGNDRYTAGGDGVNGGGGFAGTGLLVDAGGADLYTAAGHNGTNGGGWGGAGLLVDAGGSDTYSARSSGANGGGSAGSGLLIDTEGVDSYQAWSVGVNGGANAASGTGLLMDLGGRDTYAGESFGVNGGSDLGGHGLLVDREGNDQYSAWSGGVNGGSNQGVGVLLDGAGNDRYTASGFGSAHNGGATGLGATALLVDLSGTDTYSDNTGGSGTDRTVVPKEDSGAQVDLPLPPLPSTTLPSTTTTSIPLPTSTLPSTTTTSIPLPTTTSVPLPTTTSIPLPPTTLPTTTTTTAPPTTTTAPTTTTTAPPTTTTTAPPTTTTAPTTTTTGPAEPTGTTTGLGMVLGTLSYDSPGVPPPASACASTGFEVVGAVEATVVNTLLTFYVGPMSLTGWGSSACESFLSATGNLSLTAAGEAANGATIRCDSLDGTYQRVLGAAIFEVTGSCLVNGLRTAEVTFGALVATVPDDIGEGVTGHMRTASFMGAFGVVPE